MPGTTALSLPALEGPYAAKTPEDRRASQGRDHVNVIDYPQGWTAAGWVLDVGGAVGVAEQRGRRRLAELLARHPGFDHLAAQAGRRRFEGEALRSGQFLSVLPRLDWPG